MLSRKIELQANDMAEAIELAKVEKLELIIDKLSSDEDCIARILYKDSYKGYQSLLRLMNGIHALELSRIRRAMPKLNLQLLKSKNRKHEDKRI